VIADTIGNGCSAFELNDVCNSETATGATAAAVATSFDGNATQEVSNMQLKYVHTIPYTLSYMVMLHPRFAANRVMVCTASVASFVFLSRARLRFDCLNTCLNSS
jgi:hypothetical protein